MLWRHKGDHRLHNSAWTIDLMQTDWTIWLVLFFFNEVCANRFVQFDLACAPIDVACAPICWACVNWRQSSTHGMYHASITLLTLELIRAWPFSTLLPLYYSLYCLKYMLSGTLVWFAQVKLMLSLWKEMSTKKWTQAKFAQINWLQSTCTIRLARLRNLACVVCRLPNSSYNQAHNRHVLLVPLPPFFNPIYRLPSRCRKIKDPRRCAKENLNSGLLIFNIFDVYTEF